MACAARVPGTHRSMHDHLAAPAQPCYPSSLYRDLAPCCQTMIILTCCPTYPSILHPKIYSHANPAASSHPQLFFASSVNVRSKVHFEIMEHVTFSSASRRYCSRGIGAFWMRGCTEAEAEGRGGRSA